MRSCCRRETNDEADPDNRTRRAGRGGDAGGAAERRGGAALDAVLPAVKRIVADVRKRGDRALLRYAAKFDGLAGPEMRCA